MRRQFSVQRALCVAVVAAFVASVCACGVKGPLRPPPKRAPATTAPPSDNPATPPATTSPALPPPAVREGT